ncbi:hypothetical protein [Archaeoglobus sp.]
MDLKFLTRLLERAYQIQMEETELMFRAYLVEEDESKKSVLFEIYKDSELHTLILEDIIREFTGKLKARCDISYDLENLFGFERINMITRIHNMVLDLYKRILNYIGKECDEIRSKILEIVKREEEHSKKLEKLSISWHN